MKNLHFNIRVTELGDTANRLTELYKKSKNLQEDTFLKTTFAEIEKQGKAITEAVKKNQSLSKLEEADSKRDEAIRVLAKLLDGYKSIPIETLKAHGEKLANVFSKYGLKIINENYSSQSNLIDSLLLSLSAEELKPSIQALSGISEAIANIKSTQANFSTLRVEYEKAIVSQKENATASSMRKPLLDFINKKLFPYLTAMNIAQAEKYGELTSHVSQIVESINEVVKLRHKKDKGSKEKSENKSEKQE